jgi:hypothetical protein
MRNVVLNTWVLLAVALASLALSAFAAISSCNATWLGRSGSVVTVVGLLITIKHTVLSKSRNPHDVVMEKNHYANWAPDGDSPEYASAVRTAAQILRDERLGLSLTVLGTALWGYGDLLHVCAT